MTPTPTSPKLQALLVVDQVISEHRTIITTHSETCWKRHAACLAVLIRDILEGSPHD